MQAKREHVSVDHNYGGREGSPTMGDYPCMLNALSTCLCLESL